MSTPQHPLTETAAVALWDGHVPLVLNFQVWTWGDRLGILAALRAAFDAGREHERTTPAEITDEMVEAGASYAWEEANPGILGWNSLTARHKEGCRRDARAVLTAALAVATPADPHHDPRPWQDCTYADVRGDDLLAVWSRDRLTIGVAHHQDEDGWWFTADGMYLICPDGSRPIRRIPAPTIEKETPMTETTTPAEPLARTLLAVPEGYGAPHHDPGRIKAGDYAMQVDRDGFTRTGIAHRQDDDGDWYTKGGEWLTYAEIRADRPDAITVWPAPTPPAEEVELPGEPRLLTNVMLSGGEKIAEAAWTGAVLLYARHPLATSLVVAPADQIEQWTLDGTRARRDGERANGEPRFVKAREGEK